MVNEATTIVEPLHATSGGPEEERMDQTTEPRRKTKSARSGRRACMGSRFKKRYLQAKSSQTFENSAIRRSELDYVRRDQDPGCESHLSALWNLESSQAETAPLGLARKESTDCAGDWLTVKRRKQRSKEAPKNSDPAPEAQQRSPRRPPPLPKQHLKVILRPREGLVFSKWPTPVIARAVLTAGGYPRNTPNQNLIVRIESKQNIAVVSTSSEDMAARIRDINTVHLGAKEYAVATYIAPPANSARGVAHGIPQGTTDAELMRGLYAHKRNILQARMLGPCATALITFEGRTVPRYITFEGGELRCLPYRHTVKALAALVQELRVEIAELRAQLKEERSRNKPPVQESSPEPRTPPQPPQRASTASVVQETVEEMNTEAPAEPNPTAQPIDVRVTACEKGIHENRKAIQELHMRMEKGFDEIRQMITHLHEVFTPLVNDQRHKKPRVYPHREAALQQMLQEDQDGQKTE
ncbi:hypothetical protein HPB49_007099 [Dermacentor silvarum]|uniref:Uncharacterized protein n=1 Tax=Dermacentor silvarum TaxID=543639 RepID=A0ACB8D3M5_DERSI|nr:hypothetical protein HPB49_007099 [Dermacentor silvarum]